MNPAEKGKPFPEGIATHWSGHDRKDGRGESPAAPYRERSQSFRAYVRTIEAFSGYGSQLPEGIDEIAMS